MQIASRQPLWDGNATGTYLTVEMTPETGLYFRLFVALASAGRGVVEWGDGTRSEIRTTDRVPVDHTYVAYGTYRIRLRNIRMAALRLNDEAKRLPYENSVLSFVDNDGTVNGVDSGGFKWAKRLKRVSLPALVYLGQRPFAYCSGLEECRTPLCREFFDGVYEKCGRIRTLELAGGRLWRNVFLGCTGLREIVFTHVEQLSDGCFADCPSLVEIHMGDRTVAQVTQRSGTDDVVGGYGSRFPWGASPATRFRCSDGTVLGNGTVIG